MIDVTCLPSLKDLCIESIEIHTVNKAKPSIAVKNGYAQTEGGL